MKLKFLAQLVTAAAVVTSGAAMAADKETVLTNVMSPVMVNQGEAYVQAQEGMALFPGDQLMVMAGGSAQVHYATGCVEELGGNEILRISAEETCSTASTAGINGAADTSPPAGGGGGLTTAEGVAIGGVVVVTGAAVNEANNNSASKPGTDPDASN